ncbi:carbohydrate-binding protein [Longitalea luteola]|uniref:carbohydrate-binding protein n=1 Tax=Longitalea luteola TaxID=2812563 RepID=UPI001A96E425|nr:carbohydrate-binding protein [Longitalea luteola]
MKIIIQMLPVVLLLTMAFNQTASAQRSFAHPGLSHKKSDLERMKYMVQAGRDPWRKSFQNLSQNPYASYNYVVQGSPGVTRLVEPSSEAGYNYEKFKYDALASYYNAIMWYITGDERHALKSVQIFNAWSNLNHISSNGTKALDAGRVIWKMLEGAEIIKSTYTGWSQGDINKFKAMLVYPGYSTTVEPTAAINAEDATFYWYMYNGDPGRHGNQGIFAMRGIMAMGIFLDNEIMYDRALRYMMGMPHRPDDLPYPSGPRSTSATPSATYEYYDEFSATNIIGTTPDYGYNEPIANYIWENGQCQEASRDQSHTISGVSIINTMCEIAWNQGDDMYSFLDYRPLLGIEWGMRYNASLHYSFPDQPTPWEPTVENGEFIQRRDRSGRWFSKKVNPYSEKEFTKLLRGTNFKFSEYPFHEMALAHYRDRVGLSPDRYKWLQRVFDISTRESGLEGQGFQVDFPGWGGLTFRRPDNSPGDPVEFVNGKRVYKMNMVPGKIEAENFDHFVLNGQGKTYNDKTAANTGGQYRTAEAVDIETCSEGGYDVTNLENGEWINYTVAVPAAGTYKLKMRYAAVAANGALKVEFDGTDRTGQFNVPYGTLYSNGAQDWREITVGSAFTLQAGVQSMRVFITGASNAFSINSFSLSFVGSLESQTINFGTLPTKKLGDADFDAGASASSGLPVTYTSSNANVATIVDNKIRIVGSGVVTITASQEGNDAYAAASNVSQTLTITGIAAGDYVSSGNMNWNGGTWNIADGNGGYSGTTTTAPNNTKNVHMLAGHTVTLAGTAGQAKNCTVYNGGTLLQQVALTVSGLYVIDGTHTMSNTLTINDLSITGTGVLAATTAPAGSVFSLVTNKATALSINGRLGAPAGSAVTTIGSGIRVFVAGSGTTTFTGNGVMNIARFTPNSNQSSNQHIVIDMDMEVRNYAGTTVSSLSLQNGNNGSGAKTLTINAGKTVKINGNDERGSFHGWYSPGYGLSGYTNTGGVMTYNINGTLDCSSAQFNLATNQNSSNNEVIVNVNGKLKLGSTVRLFRYMATQKISINVGDTGIIDGSTEALNLNTASAGQSINTSDFTGTEAVATGLGGVTFNGSNPVVGTYAFVGNGGAGYATPPAVVFTGGTLSNNLAPTYAVANLTDGVVTSITIISTGNYSTKPTGIKFIGGGAPTQWFAFKGDNQSGTITQKVNANVATPLWIGTATSYNPVTVKPAAATVFTANVKAGDLAIGQQYAANAINRSWSIQPASATATDITFGYNTTDANAECDAAAAMRLASSDKVFDTLSAPQAAAGTNWQVSYAGVDNFPVFNLLNAGTQTIHFDALEPVMVDAADFEAGATTSSQLPVQYTSSDTSIAKIVDGKVHVVKAGIVTISATATGDVYYLNADTVSQQLTINKAFYADVDADGAGAGAAVLFAQNDAPAGYSTSNSDCNDNDAAVQHPVLYYVDADHDGFGSAATAMLCVSTAPEGYAANNTDCDDAKLMYADNDGDGLGAATLVACGVLNNTDCDDTNPVQLTATIPDVYAVNGSGIEQNTIYIGYGPTSLNITAKPVGGSAPYTYAWSNNQTTESVNLSAAGTYTVKISDARGCQTTASITIKKINVQCGNRNDKVVICHNGKSDCIAASAVAAHLKHGDKLGYCNEGDAIEDVVAYPNPVFNGRFYVKTPDYLIGNNIQVTLTDLFGRVAYQNTLPNNNGTIQVQLDRKVKGGIYLLKINGIYISKLIVL